MNDHLSFHKRGNSKWSWTLKYIYCTTHSKMQLNKLSSKVILETYPFLPWQTVFLKEVYYLYISERPPFFSQKRKFEMVVDTEVYLRCILKCNLINCHRKSFSKLTLFYHDKRPNTEQPVSKKARSQTVMRLQKRRVLFTNMRI